MPYRRKTNCVLSGRWLNKYRVGTGDALFQSMRRRGARMFNGVLKGKPHPITIFLLIKMIISPCF